MKKIVTWQAPNGETINLTPTQERILKKSGKWPKNSRGEEYCQVLRGLHHGTPTWRLNDSLRINCDIRD